MGDWRNDPIKSTGFDAQIKHEDGFELHFYTDRLEAYRAVEKVCQEQIDRKPKTHGDELRTMTDEELATLFTKVMAGNSGAQLDGIWKEKGMEENQRYFTRLNWLDWLKQEVKE